MDLPHTISYAVSYRMSIDSFRELPKDKRPPRNLWDKPYRLNEFFDEMFGTKEVNTTTYVEYDPEDVE